MSGYYSTPGLPGLWVKSRVTKFRILERRIRNRNTAGRCRQLWTHCKYYPLTTERSSIVEISSHGGSKLEREQEDYMVLLVQ